MSVKKWLVAATALLFAAAAISGCIGRSGEYDTSSQDGASGTDGIEDEYDATEPEDAAPEAPAAETLEADKEPAFDPAIFTVVLDEEDVILRAHKAQICATQTEKQNDGRWYVFPFKNATRILVELTWEPSETCKELGLLDLEPSESTETSKLYEIAVAPKEWGMPHALMIVPETETMSVAYELPYHIT